MHLVLTPGVVHQGEVREGSLLPRLEDLRVERQSQGVPLVLMGLVADTELVQVVLQVLYGALKS